MGRTWGVVCSCCILGGALLAQAPVTLKIGTASRQFRIPGDFAGLGFETKSAVADTYGVHGNFFSPANTQLITLFRNIGIRNIRVGGGTVDGSGKDEHCVTPTPSFADIDNLFAFARAAGVKVIYSVRLLNLGSCPNPHLAEDDAKSSPTSGKNTAPSSTASPSATSPMCAATIRGPVRWSIRLSTNPHPAFPDRRIPPTSRNGESSPR